MADEDVDDALFAVAAFCYMFDTSDDEDNDDGESKRKRLCRPRRFWVHDVIRGREVSKSQCFDRLL